MDLEPDLFPKIGGIPAVPLNQVREWKKMMPTNIGHGLTQPLPLCLVDPAA
jgi:hypothetical protein